MLVNLKLLLLLLLAPFNSLYLLNFILQLPNINPGITNQTCNTLHIRIFPASIVIVTYYSSPHYNRVDLIVIIIWDIEIISWNIGDTTFLTFYRTKLIFHGFRVIWALHLLHHVVKWGIVIHVFNVWVVNLLSELLLLLLMRSYYFK